ncbi:MAG: hypothetical protein ACLSAH_19180 [Bilophila wadsworthia]
MMKRMVDWGFYSACRAQLLPAENERQRFLTPKELDSCSICSKPVLPRMRIALLSAHGYASGNPPAPQTRFDFTNNFIHVDGKMGKRVAYMDDTVKTMLERIAPQQPSEFIFQQGQTDNPRRTALYFAKAVSILG